MLKYNFRRNQPQSIKMNLGALFSIEKCMKLRAELNKTL